MPIMRAKMKVTDVKAYYNYESESKISGQQLLFSLYFTDSE
jgi:hypothetical protein